MLLDENIKNATHCNCNPVLHAKFQRIIKNINVYSSSCGIKFCDVKFIDDNLLREKIKPLANNNINVMKAAHLLLFYTWDKPVPAINSFDHSNTSLTDDSSTSVNSSTHKPVFNFIYNVQNTYQALGAGLKTAADEQVDAFLIEDLQYDKIDALLELKQEALRSVALLALNNKNTADNNLYY